MFWGICFLILASFWGFVFGDYLLTGDEPTGFTQGSAYLSTAWLYIIWAFDEFGRA